MESAHAGREEHADGWMNRYLHAQGASEGDAIPRRGAGAAAAARAAGYRAGAGDRADLAVRDPRRPVHRNGAVVVRGGVRGGGEQRPPLDRARGVRRGEDVEEVGSLAVRAVERRRVSARRRSGRRCSRSRSSSRPTSASRSRLRSPATGTTTPTRVRRSASSPTVSTISPVESRRSSSISATACRMSS